MIYLFPLLVVVIGMLFRIAMVRKYNIPDRPIDLGEIVLPIFLVYGFMPGIGFMMEELGYGQVQDLRLYDGYALESLVYVEGLFLLFAIFFALAYVVARNPMVAKFDHSVMAKRFVGPIIIVTLTVMAMLQIIGQLWGSDIEGDYKSSYTALRGAPIFIQQIAGVATQLQLTLMIAAVVLSIAAWPKRHLYVLGALGVNLAYVAIAGGSRTDAFLTFLAYVVASSIYVPGFRIQRAAMLAVPALMLFLVAGMLRGGDVLVPGLIRSGGTGFDLLSIFQGSEFSATFVTPIDLYARFPDGFDGQAPFNIYTVDILRLIPSQLLSVEKVSPADWYAQTFYEYYYELGGGFAFGILSESVLGLGLSEAAIRGALLGIFFAFAANRLLTRQSSPIQVVAYVWLIILGYQCYRDTSFSILARMVFHLAPVLIFMKILQSSKRNRELFERHFAT